MTANGVKLFRLPVCKGCVMKKEFIKSYSLHEALNALRGEAPDGGAVASVYKEPSADWDMCAGYDGAVRMAVRGWADGLRGIDSLLVAGSPDAGRLAFDVVHDVVGDTVDVGVFLEGEPECMSSYVPTVKPVFELMLNVAASVGVSAETLQRRGAIVFGVCRSLELMGYSVGITANWSVERGDYYSEINVRVKEPSEYITPEVAAFWLTHPACLRRVFFRIGESLSYDHRRAGGFIKGSGYGQPTECRNIPGGCLYFGDMHLNRASRLRDSEDIFNAVKAELAAAGVMVS